MWASKANADDAPCVSEGLFCLRRALFAKSGKKYQKAPVETHGFHPSFPRRTTQPAAVFTARQNRREKTSPKCCMAASTNPLDRSLLQNVEVCTPTFQSGAAAKREAGTTPDLHQNAVFTKRTVGGVSCKQVSPKGGQGTIGSLRRFFGDFLSLVKESYSSKTGQGRSLAGSIVSVSGLLRTRPLCQLLILNSSFLPVQLALSVPE